MKKTNKSLLTIIVMLSTALSFCVLLFSNIKVEAAKDEQATIILHKKKMIKAPSKLTQNTGGIMTEFDEYENLEGVHFELYDATTEFYLARNAGKTSEEATRTIQSAKPSDLEGRLPVAEGITDAQGEIRFTVNKQVGGKDAVYLLVELPKAGIIGAANLVIGFPVFELNSDGTYTDKELNEVHIYPKNIISDVGTLLVNKKGTALDNQYLDGAEFILSKEVDKLQMYVKSANGGLYTWTTNDKEAQRFVTGHTYSPADNNITEVDNSQGRLAILGLELQEYKLIEVKAPTNASMINRTVETTITLTNDNATIEVDILNDTVDVTKESDKQGKSVEIGQRINYEITSTIPVGINDTLEGDVRRYTSYKLVDKHSPELTFDNQIEGEFAYQLMDNETPIDSENYTVEEQENGFIVSINENYLPNLTPNGKLVFSYFMYLNDKAVPGVDYSNTVKVETGDLTDEADPVKVVTGGAKFQKIDQDGKNKGLKGAEFVIQDAALDNYVAIDEKTKEISWTEDKSKATTFVSDENGYFEITGLSFGKYKLIETKAPEGYIKKDKELEFEVNKNSYNNAQVVKVLNRHKGSLPVTGGIGRVIFAVVGISAFGLTIMYFRQRLLRTN